MWQYHSDFSSSVRRTSTFVCREYQQLSTYYSISYFIPCWCVVPWIVVDSLGWSCKQCPTTSRRSLIFGVRCSSGIVNVIIGCKVGPCVQEFIRRGRHGRLFNYYWSIRRKNPITHIIACVNFVVTHHYFTLYLLLIWLDMSYPTFFTYDTSS